MARYEAEPDSDEDGIPDRFETGMGIYVSPEDTGTSPTNPDTDGDDLTDGAEVNTITPTAFPRQETARICRSPGCGCASGCASTAS